MDKIKNTVSLCRKAGALAVGSSLTLEAIKRSRAHLILLTSDLPPKTEKEITFQAGNAHIEMRRLPLSMDDIDRAISKRVGVLAVCDKGLAEKMTQVIDCAQGKE